ncbi:MAG: SDR family NAD(P)-dependent oxidoreductase [Aureispira sp.]
MNNKRVLVTGGTGFVGAYLLRYLLQAGYAVRATKRPTSPMELVADIQDQLEWVEGDILDPTFVEAAMQDMQQVYHSAAMISFDPKKVATMMKVNVEGTANIVNAALYEGVEKLVHVSSIAALGRREFQPHIDERIQWENSKENSNYAISKFRAECEVWRAREEGLTVAIINPSTIIGAGYWQEGSCRIVKEAARGLRYYPTGSTGFVDVRDVARAAIALMESAIEGERYIVNGDNRSYKNFFSILSKELGTTAPQWTAPNWMLKTLSTLDWLRSKLSNSAPILTREILNNVQSTYYYNNEKIIADLQFEFTPLDLCLQETAKIYQESQAKHPSYGVLDLV